MVAKSKARIEFAIKKLNKRPFWSHIDWSYDKEVYMMHILIFIYAKYTQWGKIMNISTHRTVLCLSL